MTVMVSGNGAGGSRNPHPGTLTRPSKRHADASAAPSQRRLQGLQEAGFSNSSTVISERVRCARTRRRPPARRNRPAMCAVVRSCDRARVVSNSGERLLLRGDALRQLWQRHACQISRSSPMRSRGSRHLAGCRADLTTDEQHLNVHHGPRSEYLRVLSKPDTTSHLPVLPELIILSTMHWSSKRKNLLERRQGGYWGWECTCRKASTDR